MTLKQHYKLPSASRVFHDVGYCQQPAGSSGRFYWKALDWQRNSTRYGVPLGISWSYATRPGTRESSACPYLPIRRGLQRVGKATAVQSTHIVPECLPGTWSSSAARRVRAISACVRLCNHTSTSARSGQRLCCACSAMKRGNAWWAQCLLRKAEKRYNQKGIGQRSDYCSSHPERTSSRRSGEPSALPRPRGPAPRGRRFHDPRHAKKVHQRPR